MPAPAGDPLFVVPRGRLAVLGAIALAAFMAEGAMGDWSAIYLRMDLGASPVTAAWGFAAFSLTMAVGRLTGDRLVARFSPAAIVVAGALIGASTLAAALAASHPAAAVLGFAGIGLGLANVAPIVFSAAGRMPDLAPGIGIAAVSTAGYCGFLAGPPLIGLVAEGSSLTVALGLVAAVVGMMTLGTGALPGRQRQTVAVAV
jgi:MFS family permease